MWSGMGSSRLASADSKLDFPVIGHTTRHRRRLSTKALVLNKWRNKTPPLSHTHSFNGPFSGTAWVSRYEKGKPIWILPKQETVSGSGISWAISKSAPRSRQITTPAPHHSSFLQARCPSCRPTQSVKALKAKHKMPTSPTTLVHKGSRWKQVKKQALHAGENVKQSSSIRSLGF